MCHFLHFLLRATVGLSVVTRCHPSYLDSTQRLGPQPLPRVPRKSWQLEGVSHSYTHSHCGRRNTRRVRILRDRRASLQSLDVDSAVKKEERKKKIRPTASPKVTKGKGENCLMWVILPTSGQRLHSICLLLAKAHRPHLDTIPPVPEGAVLRVPHPGNIRSRDLSVLGWSRASYLSCRRPQPRPVSPAPPVGFPANTPGCVLANRPCGCFHCYILFLSPVRGSCTHLL